MISGVNPIGGFSLPGFENFADAASGGKVADPAASFAAALTQAAGNTVAALDKAEAASLQALQGEVPTRAVVDAVMSAEQSLQAAIAIRDKIVTAYLEISRMQI